MFINKIVTHTQSVDQQHIHIHTHTNAHAHLTNYLPTDHTQKPTHRPTRPHTHTYIYNLKEICE